MSKMEGLVAIVTGASRGVGRAIAKAYAAEGARVVVCARPESPTGLPGTLQETVRDIEADGGEAFSVPCDVTDDAQVGEMVRRTLERYGQIDVLVNNAGVMIMGESFLDVSLERWDKIMRVNTRGPYLTHRHVLPGMMGRRKGSIINIGARLGVDHSRVAGVMPYSTSKAALHMFSLALAEELREYNIAINFLSPGVVKSEGLAAITTVQRDWTGIPDPDVVGPSAVYLALQDAASMTAQFVVRDDFGKTWGL